MWNAVSWNQDVLGEGMAGQSGQLLMDEELLKDIAHRQQSVDLASSTKIKEANHVHADIG